ncbi:hypothetical protein OAU93_01690 [bacterium]|nr:hypothetical protein [bacterium]
MVQLFVSKVAELKYWIDDDKIPPQKWIPVLLEIEALQQQIFDDSIPAISLELSARNSGGAIALHHPMTGVKRHFVNFRSDTTDELREFTGELMRILEAWHFLADNTQWQEVPKRNHRIRKKGNQGHATWDNHHKQFQKEYKRTGTSIASWAATIGLDPTECENEFKKCRARKSKKQRAT